MTNHKLQLVFTDSLPKCYLNITYVIFSIGYFLSPLAHFTQSEDTRIEFNHTNNNNNNNKQKPAGIIPHRD